MAGKSKGMVDKYPKTNSLRAGHMQGAHGLIGIANLAQTWLRKVADCVAAFQHGLPSGTTMWLHSIHPVTVTRHCKFTKYLGA